jgi:PHD/YefM family antitoxin component YafN of YafNO toxin-antitoxin module
MNKRALYSVVKSAINNTQQTRGAFMTTISANDLKTKGISAIESVLALQSEAVISVRGKERFVIMDLEHYHYLRECELEAALAQTRADIAAGRLVKESAEDHLSRLKASL